MSNYGWTNEDGEPIMDGAAYRFEQQLDMDSRDDYYADHFYDNDDEPECDESNPNDPAHDGWSWNSNGEAECDWCGTRLPQHDGDYDPTPVHQWEVTEGAGYSPDTRGEHDPTL